VTPRERILAVYRGEVPDRVPFMLDLSHWFYHRQRRPWDLSQAYEKPETDLIAEHRRLGVGFYLPNLGSFYSVDYADGVRAETVKAGRGGVPEITWRFRTPCGSIERRRIWEETTYSWPISAWGVRTERDLRILAEALAARRYRPRWERYQAWLEEVGDLGVVYLSPGYSAMGHLLNYWMGVEQVMYAAADWPETLRETVSRINANSLDLIDLLADSPAEVILMGDNFSSDIQPPHFFAEWSRDYYAEAIRRLHAAGKWVAVHIDGRLRGALGMFAELGADCADAVTPKPMGDLTPAECRLEAGPGMILSGGVSPDLWLPGAATPAFAEAVRAWLDLRSASPRLIANAGDQVPPGASEERIALMRDMVEAEGRFQ
jgi:hypothetical protein